MRLFSFECIFERVFRTANGILNHGLYIVGLHNLHTANSTECLERTPISNSHLARLSCAGNRRCQVFVDLHQRPRGRLHAITLASLSLMINGCHSRTCSSKTSSSGVMFEMSASWCSGSRCSLLIFFRPPARGGFAVSD